MEVYQDEKNKKALWRYHLVFWMKKQRKTII